MVKTIIGGVDVQKYITAYSCQCPSVDGSNGFFDMNGEWVSDKKGDEAILNITLEEVPTPVSEQLASVLGESSVEVDYTTPVPRHGSFYKTSYNATCEDADPDEYDFEITDGILWNIDFSLRSAGLTPLSGGL